MLSKASTVASRDKSKQRTLDVRKEL